ncbi:MAG: hypothetical protein JWR61_1499 [Ferruginibacter sp.]|nr:hypothetical protein [Ferruginibacter sp.]
MTAVKYPVNLCHKKIYLILVFLLLSYNNTTAKSLKHLRKKYFSNTR